MEREKINYFWIVERKTLTEKQAWTQALAWALVTEPGSRALCGLNVGCQCEVVRSINTLTQHAWRVTLKAASARPAAAAAAAAAACRLLSGAGTECRCRSRSRVRGRCGSGSSRRLSSGCSSRPSSGGGGGSSSNRSSLSSIGGSTSGSSASTSPAPAGRSPEQDPRVPGRAARSRQTVD